MAKIGGSQANIGVSLTRIEASGIKIGARIWGLSGHD